MSVAEIDELRFCSQWCFIHAPLSHVPFALARLSCYSYSAATSALKCYLCNKWFHCFLQIVNYNHTSILFSIWSHTYFKIKTKTYRRYWSRGIYCFP